MKVNLGCQQQSMDGYINVDIVDYPGVDRVADIDDYLPFEANSLTEIYASHVFEHLTNPIRFLVECWRVLEPLGRLSLVLPDLTCNQAIYSDRMFGIITGLGFTPDDMEQYDVHALHRTFWSPGSLLAFVSEFGFVYVGAINIEQDPRISKAHLWQFGQEFSKIEFPHLEWYQAYLNRRQDLEDGIYA